MFNNTPLLQKINSVRRHAQHSLLVTRYSLPGHLLPPKSYGGEFDTKGLDENRVYQRLALSLNLTHALKSEPETVFQYVFTEMLNNAIDHSESRKVRVSAALEPGSVTAEIKDSEIGVFVFSWQNGRFFRFQARQSGASQSCKSFVMFYRRMEREI